MGLGPKGIYTNCLIVFYMQPESRLSNYSGAESDVGDMEPRLYNVLVTLHSGHNLAIRDRTGN